MESSLRDEFRRWARFGVDQDGVKYIPVGGTCIMAYLIDQRNDEILLGKIDGDGYGEYWRNNWGVYIHRESIWRDKWFVPSGFLHYGEEPGSCAERILKELLRASAGGISLMGIVSYTQRSKYYIGYNHWHICFVYRTHEFHLGGTPPWFKELRYIPLNSLTSRDIGVAGGPVLKKLGLIKE